MLESRDISLALWKRHWHPCKSNRCRRGAKFCRCRRKKWRGKVGNGQDAEQDTWVYHCSQGAICWPYLNEISSLITWCSAPQGFCCCVWLLPDHWFSDEFASIWSKQFGQRNGLLFCYSSLTGSWFSGWPQAPLVCACYNDRIAILEKLLNMNNIDLSADFVNSLFSFFIKYWLTNNPLQCHVRVFYYDFEHFVDISNSERSSTAWRTRSTSAWRCCLPVGLNTIPFVFFSWERYQCQLKFHFLQGKLQRQAATLEKVKQRLMKDIKPFMGDGAWEEQPKKKAKRN